MRTALWGLVAIAGAAAALVRHSTHEPPPLRVPVRVPVRPVAPAAAPTDGYDIEAGEVPAPELLEPGASTDVSPSLLPEVPRKPRAR